MMKRNHIATIRPPYEELARQARDEVGLGRTVKP